MTDIYLRPQTLVRISGTFVTGFWETIQSFANNFQSNSDDEV